MEVVHGNRTGTAITEADLMLLVMVVTVHSDHINSENTGKGLMALVSVVTHQFMVESVHLERTSLGITDKRRMRLAIVLAGDLLET